jgi:hypothetical protein
MRLRYGVLVAALTLVVAACGGGKKVTQPGATGTTTPGNTRPAFCDDATLTAPEVGVTASNITITVMADTGSTLRPGLFKGSIEAVKAWAAYVNDNGGLACRRVVVKEADSKLSPNDARNGASGACRDSLAMVGTTALFFQDVSILENCKDKQGKATGLPDFAELQTEVAHQCSNKSYAVLPNTGSCPYSGSGPRTYRVGYTQYQYYLDHLADLGVDSLHGVFVIPKDLPSTISATMPLIRAENRMGIESDAEFGISALATQPEYTRVAQAIKQNNSTYARNGLDFRGTVLMRKEAQAQGVTSVKVWDCSVQCYDQKLITEGGSAVEGQYVWLNHLPLEDGDAHPELAAFLEYDKAPDGFGLIAWAAAQAFARAVNDAIAANGNDPNAITRANLLEAVRNLHEFDANGLIPKTDIGGKRGSDCVVGMQVKSGKFVRIHPTEPGTFACGQRPPLEFSIDPVAEYRG